MRALRGGLGGVLAAAIGLAVIAWTYGVHILPPSHTGWMLTGTLGPDPVQYWLGWTYFAGDAWRWPPGLNPDWGLEVSSSVFYSDSIPLLAFAFKALRPLVEVAQYWGLWIFACGALQALMAWRLIGLATTHPLPRLAGAALFALSPMMLNRLGGHFALGAHFLILAALYLALTRARPGLRLLQWVALILVASLVHSYLLPMVAGIWAGDWLARALRRPARPGWLAVEVPLVPGVGVLGLYLAGFFVLSGGFGGTWGGYGQMQLDLLAPFDAGVWSRWLPNLPDPRHLESGHSYLGLGAMLALALGLAGYLRRPFPWLSARWPLLLALLVLLAIAVSHRVSFGGRVTELVVLPDRVHDYADALRASERFFWPLAYAAILAAIFAMLRSFGPARAGAMLAVLALLQFGDLQKGFGRLAAYFPPGPAVAPLRLQDPVWAELAERYRRVRLAPTGMQAQHWEEVAVLAATHGLPTDAVYLARLDPRRVAALNAAVLDALASGRHEAGTLYVLGSAETLAAARAGMDPRQDLLTRADGIWLLAPGWRGSPVIAETPKGAEAHLFR